MPPRTYRAPALGAVELVAGEAQHINVLGLDVDGQVARRLNGVGVEQDALFPAHGADLLNGQDAADLVVGVHDGHETGVRAKGALHLLRRDRADGADGQKLDLESLFFKQHCYGSVSDSCIYGSVKQGFDLLRLG